VRKVRCHNGAVEILGSDVLTADHVHVKVPEQATLGRGPVESIEAGPAPGGQLAVFAVKRLMSILVEFSCCLE